MLSLRLQLLTGSAALSSAPNTCSDGVFEVRPGGEIQHRYCELQVVRQLGRGPIGAALFWPSIDALVDVPRVESEASGGALIVRVGSDTWRLQVAAQADGKVLVVER